MADGTLTCSSPRSGGALLKFCLLSFALFIQEVLISLPAPFADDSQYSVCAHRQDFQCAVAIHIRGDRLSGARDRPNFRAIFPAYRAQFSIRRREYQFLDAVPIDIRRDHIATDRDVIGP